MFTETTYFHDMIWKSKDTIRIVLHFMLSQSWYIYMFVKKNNHFDEMTDLQIKEELGK